MNKKIATSPEKKAALEKIRDEFMGTAGRAQASRLLEALSRFPINTFEASRYLDVYHCPARVLQLRKQGWLNDSGKLPDRWRLPEQCAATSVWAATAPELNGVGGIYLENCNQAGPWRPEEPMAGVKPYALSRDNALRLWDMSERLVAA